MSSPEASGSTRPDVPERGPLPPRHRNDPASLTSPRWLLLFAIVAGLVVTFVLLGNWQLGRWSEARDEQAAVAVGLAAPPLDLSDVADRTATDPESLRFTRIAVDGTFVPAEEVLWRNRAHRGQQGFHVVTPLRLDTPVEVAGDLVDTVLVDRGFVPADRDTPPVADAAPPAGSVTVTGYLLPSIAQPGFGARDPDDGVLQRVFNVTVPRLDGQVEGTLLPMFVMAQDLGGAADDGLPRLADPPEVDTTQNLSYAGQWYAFALIALVGTVAFARRRVRR